MASRKQSDKTPKQIRALKVHQWLTNWDGFRFDANEQQAKPSPGFLLCSVRAADLKALTGVYRRSTKGGLARVQDPNVQRGYEENRSKVIREYVKFGFPWCEMGDAKRKRPGADDLRQPGWLPTAILVNILPVGSKRNGREIAQSDLVEVEENGDTVTLNLPSTFSGVGWEPTGIYPLEVIDGQHRLWAFEDFDPGDFELPVAAFYGLDHGWQAYLFYSVNITPKKINRSLAFDLYPLLRKQSWLDKFEGHSMYRETRCQELVEALWGNEKSPWYARINMLGERKEDREYKGPMVSQAAWVRSLMASFIKQWEGHGSRIGGLFGAPRKADEPSLPWNRAMQAAFLILAGRLLKVQVEATKSPWAKELRKLQSEIAAEDDKAFYGEYSLLTTDQGIRGFLFVVNDLCYLKATELELSNWRWESVYEDPQAAKLAATEEDAVAAALLTLAETKLAKFLTSIAKRLSTYDWRSSSTDGLSEAERIARAAFRGSGGYRELRLQLLLHLQNGDEMVGNAAQLALAALRSTDE